MVGILPMKLTVGGVDYPINTDFRTCLAVTMAQSDPELTTAEKVTVALEMMFGAENLPENSHVKEAYEKVAWFLNCGREAAESEADEHALPLMDWEQDEMLIFSGIAAAIGRDVRMDAYCHYWSFMSYFMCMGECTFTAVRTIRQKLQRHEKLEKWEQAFYKANREVVDLKRAVEVQEDLFQMVFGKEMG